MARITALILLHAVFLLNVASLPYSLFKQIASTNAPEFNATIPPLPSGLLLIRDALLISDKGLCGADTNNTCLNSLFGDSCSRDGFCGSYYDAQYAGPGCQPTYGMCNPQLPNSMSETAAPSKTTSTRSKVTTPPTGTAVVPMTTTRSTPTPIAPPPHTSAAHNQTSSTSISPKGLCGSEVNMTCRNSLFGDSCSAWGFCGSYFEAEYSGPGCQPSYGVCNPQLTNSTNAIAAAPTMTITVTAKISTLQGTGIARIAPITVTTVVEPATTMSLAWTSVV